MCHSGTLLAINLAPSSLVPNLGDGGEGFAHKARYQMHHSSTVPLAPAQGPGGGLGKDYP